MQHLHAHLKNAARKHSSAQKEHVIMLTDGTVHKTAGSSTPATTCHFAQFARLARNAEDAEFRLTMHARQDVPALHLAVICLISTAVLVLTGIFTAQ